MTVVSFAHYSNINRKIRNGRTPLMHAAANGHDYLVEKLLEHNANPELVDDNGNTAVEIATANQYNDIAQLLTDAGMKGNKSDEN